MFSQEHCTVLEITVGIFHNNRNNKKDLISRTGPKITKQVILRLGKLFFQLASIENAN